MALLNLRYINIHTRLDQMCTTVSCQSLSVFIFMPRKFSQSPIILLFCIGLRAYKLKTSVNENVIPFPTAVAFFSLIVKKYPNLH